MYKRQVYDRKDAVPILVGGGLAAGLLYWQYSHAKKAGLAAAAEGAPGTESY